MDKLKRFAEDDLLKWYHKKNRKPIILRGARQAGKSTLVREFAKNQGLNLCEINLERYLFLNDIFKTLDLTKIINELEGIIGRNIQRADSILFLDEIQATPYALQALRYFYEDRPEIPVISAGSLLEFILADHNFSMPVGRIEYYHLGPMTFKEYVFAVDKKLYSFFSGINLKENIPESVHLELLNRQREYLFIGGMPEAVAEYNESQSMLEVNNIQSSIINTYLDDFSKYAKQKDLVLLQKIFRTIPRILGKKIKYSNISPDHKAKDIRSAIDLLIKAGICIPVYHSHCSGIPLNSDIDYNTYKLIFLDIGLVNCILGMDWKIISNLDSNRLINEGALAEQFIGQNLLYTNNKLFPGHLNYWLREGKANNAEIDYVISHNTQIIPVVVKSGKSGSLKSLQQFAFLKNAKNAVRFDLNKPEYQMVDHHLKTGNEVKQVKYSLLSLPLYMVEELYRLLDELF